MTEKISYIPSRLKNASVGGHVAGAADIYDDGREQTQQQINEQVDQAITTLDTSISGDNIIVGTRPTTGTPGKIYRVVNNNNTYTDYMYSNGWITLATHDTSNEQSQVAYYTCVGTGSGAQATKQFISNGSLTYNPSNGGHIKIKMGEANTATGTIYLQFGTTTSTKKPLYYNGEPASPDNTWGEGETIAVYYDPSANSNAGAYFASNAQGGGGKAEKIKYDNSQNGLGAENVQRAIDTVYTKTEDNTEFRELGGFITANGFAAGSNGVWTQVSSSNYTHKHIAVTSDMKVIKVTANSNKSANIFFVTEYDTPANTEKVKFCEGTLPVIIQAGQTKELLIPSDCGSIIVDCQGGSNDYTPSSIKIGYKDVSKTANDSYKAVKEHYDMLTMFKRLTGWTSGTGLASGVNGVWTQVGNSKYTHEYIAREEGMKILKVTAKSSKSAYVFFVKEYVTPVNGESVVFCEGTATNSIQAGKSDVFIIPDDCAYIIVSMKANTNDFTPDSVEINDGDKLSTSVDIDFDDYEELLGWISGTGEYLGTAGSGHYVIDVRGYDKFIGITNATNASYFIRASAVNGNSWTKYGEREDPAANTSFEFKTFGQPYLIVGNYSSQGNRDIANSVLPQSLSLVSSDRIGTLESRVEKLEDGGIGQTDIISLNGKAELDTMFKAATRADRTVTSGGITTEATPVVFLHFSDLHGNESNLIRIVSLYNAYSDYVDDVINTGDTILSKYGDDFAFYASRGAGGFLNVIGNHDAQKGSNSYATETELYTKFIGPFISQWGVTSYTENKCYYYKDYEDSNLRLIVLDAYNVNWNSNNAQVTWLEGVLADAITNELHVMIAVHSGLCRKSDLDCNFNSMQARWNWLGSNDNVVTWQGQVDGYLGSVVDTFIQNGGKFICWLSGHTHCDVMGLGARHPNQMTINIGSSGSMELVNSASDIERVEGTKSQDCVNMVVVDTFKKQLKLYRIGGDIDRYFRSRKALVYDYENREVVYYR